MSWTDSIALNRSLIHQGQTDLNVIVSGSAIDGAFWERTVDSIKRDTLREDGRSASCPSPRNSPSVIFSARSMPGLA